MCVTQESVSAPTLEALSSGIAIPIRNLHNANNALMSTLPGAGAEEGAAYTEDGVQSNVNNAAHEVRESGKAGEGEGGEGDSGEGEGREGEDGEGDSGQADGREGEGE